MPIFLWVLTIFFYLGMLIYIKRNKNTLMHQDYLTVPDNFLKNALTLFSLGLIVIALWLYSPKLT